jgi:hypothetical protein
MCSLHDLAVQAKREIGRLWEDVTNAPYTDLFSATTTATRLWRAVQAIRAVEGELAIQRAGLVGRDRLVAVHANRFIARMVFRALAPGSLDNPGFDFNVELGRIPGLVRRILGAVTADVATTFPQSYPASIFKNATKCRDIETRM